MLLHQIGFLLILSYDARNHELKKKSIDSERYCHMTSLTYRHASLQQ